MASITASSSASLVARASLVRNGPAGISSPPLLGLPAMAMKKGKVRCAMERKPSTSMAAALVAAASAAATWGPTAAVALVDERMSTEGTGLPFGLSNNVLGWILLGVFGLIWALYFVYASSLVEDEESGLSL